MGKALSRPIDENQPTYEDVIKYIKDKAILDNKLYELYDSRRLSKTSQKTNGHLFKGNIYKAILEMDKFLQPDIHFIMDKYIEFTDYKEYKCVAVLVQDMIDNWLTDNFFWIAEYTPIIH